MVWLLGPYASLPVGPCLLGVDPLRSAIAYGSTNAYAFASLATEVPADRSLVGATIYVQAAIADAASAIGVTLIHSYGVIVGG